MLAIYQQFGMLEICLTINYFLLIIFFCISQDKVLTNFLSYPKELEKLLRLSLEVGLICSFTAMAWCYGTAT